MPISNRQQGSTSYYPPASAAEPSWPRTDTVLSTEVSLPTDTDQSLLEAPCSTTYGPPDPFDAISALVADISDTSFTSPSQPTLQSTAVPGKSCLRRPQIFPPTRSTINSSPTSYTAGSRGRAYFKQSVKSLKAGRLFDKKDSDGTRHIISRRADDDVTEGCFTHTVLDGDGRVIQHWDLESDGETIVPASLFTVKKHRGTFFGDTLQSELEGAMSSCGASTRGASRLRWGGKSEQMFSVNTAPDTVGDERWDETVEGSL